MKRILLISPIPTHPQIAGNRTRIQRLLLSLRDMGHEVHFLCVNTEPWKADEEAMARWWGKHFYRVAYRHPPRSLRRYISRLRFLFEPGFLEIQPVDYRYDNALDIVLRELAKSTRFDVVIVEYIFWSKALECFDDSVLKIIDTHDVFTRRHMLYRKAGQDYGWYCTTAKEEAKALNRADVVVAIQDQEREYFSRLTSRPVITVRHIAPLRALPPRERNEANLLFIGSDAGTNIHGLRSFLAQTFPRIRGVVPHAMLHLAGQICDNVPDAEGCIKHGVVDDLDSLYEVADIVVNPIEFSTGLCIKTIEALGYGRPVVTTSAGSRGLEDGAGQAFLVADSPDDFAQAVLHVARDAARARSLARAAYRFVERWNAESLHELRNVVERKSSNSCEDFAA